MVIPCSGNVIEWDDIVKMITYKWCPSCEKNVKVLFSSRKCPYCGGKLERDA